MINSERITDVSSGVPEGNHDENSREAHEQEYIFKEFLQNLQKNP